MLDLQASIETLRRIGDAPNGLAELSREAGVPYTTVKSFRDRGWSNKSLDVLSKLLPAALRLEERNTGNLSTATAPVTGIPTGDIP